MIRWLAGLGIEGPHGDYMNIDQWCDRVAEALKLRHGMDVDKAILHSIAESFKSARSLAGSTDKDVDAELILVLLAKVAELEARLRKVDQILFDKLGRSSRS